MSDLGPFMNMPSEIVIDILSRLPAHTAIICKVVCKKWLDLLSEPEFIRLHLSRSTPGLLIYQMHRFQELCRLVEFKDELHYSPWAKIDTTVFTSSGSTVLEGSANGLVFFRAINTEPDPSYICNPITREYITVPRAKGTHRYPTIVTYGFGVSTIKGQYKLVRMFHDRKLDPETHACLSIPKGECQIYTLGTGLWRSTDLSNRFSYNCRSIGTFFKGNLHWIVEDLEGSELISCFDLENEIFQAFPPPPIGDRPGLDNLGVLHDNLCLCENTSETEIVIWIMKEYGAKNSWTRQYVISKLPDFAGESYETVLPLKVFKNGDILLLWGDFFLFIYYNENRTIQAVDMVELQNYGHPEMIQAILHVPSFVPLRSFATEDVIKF